MGDGFSVEDLLDLEELCEVDKDGGEQVEAEPAAVEQEKSSESHGSSVVSYEPMPLLAPVIDLPAHDAEELEWVSRIMDDSLAELPPTPQLPAAALAACKPQHRREQARPGVSDWTLCSLPISSTNNGRPRNPSTERTANKSPKSAGASQSISNHRTSAAVTLFPPRATAAAATAVSRRRPSGAPVRRAPRRFATPAASATSPAASSQEYRPACSPTFVTDLHSNSHRKVLEMRRKKETDIVAAPPAVASF
ncbi:hypothetical protein GUJ93_ZPchr0006g44985 [Zizania palustris]|uniref:Uncharacterized protein n=1 Tax=Zizania palustris TaxID=103762 RepID=A0A8J5T7S6_ZIZPA|nr:hypothetical protein GUJ93_ZPchr0006g44985 [Zizania palustris]